MHMRPSKSFTTDIDRRTRNRVVKNGFRHEFLKNLPKDSMNAIAQHCRCNARVTIGRVSMDNMLIFVEQAEQSSLERLALDPSPNDVTRGECQCNHCCNILKKLGPE